jgi:RHS repeat-associated protein
LNYIRHTDWLGSSRLATTWAHAVYSKEAYAPFGETYNEAGTPDRSFTGQDQDVATGPGGAGVYDFLFRKYDPSAGRWLSPDPYGWGAVDQTAPQSLNRYAYVMNNPMNAVDPLGLVCISSDGSYDNSYDGPAAGCNGYYVQGFIGDGGMSYGEGMNQAINSPEYHFGYNTPPYQITGVNFAGNVSSGYSGYSGYYVIHSSGFDPNTGNIIIATNEYTYSDPSTAQWFYNTLANQSGATNGPGAPNNGPNYTRADVCAASTLLNKGAGTFLDALGIIPGEGNLLAGIQAGAGLISAGMAVSGGSPTDLAFSGGGLGLTAASLTYSKTAVQTLRTTTIAGSKMIPILGNILSIGATANDIWGKEGMVNYYNDCMAGKN